MASKINRLCRGLLGLLDAQTQGDNPTYVQNEIYPGLASATFLHNAVGLKTQSTSFTGLQGAVFIPAITCPVGKTWWVRYASIQIYSDTPLVVATTFRAVMAMMLNSNENPIGIGGIGAVQEFVGGNVNDQFASATWAAYFGADEAPVMNAGDSINGRVEYVNPVPPAGQLDAFLTLSYIETAQA